jgi:hypothetical protein
LPDPVIYITSGVAGNRTKIERCRWMNERYFSIIMLPANCLTPGINIKSFIESQIAAWQLKYMTLRLKCNDSSIVTNRT